MECTQVSIIYKQHSKTYIKYTKKLLKRQFIENDCEMQITYQSPTEKEVPP